MTNVETRLQRELPIVADAILAQPAQPAIVPGSKTRPVARVLAVAAAAVAIVAVGVLVVSRLAPPVAVIETAAGSARVEGLESETLWLVTSTMEPAIPREGHVRLFALTDDVVLERGDLVVVPQRGTGNVELVRRIVGLPGEVVSNDEDLLLLAGRDGEPSMVTGLSPESTRSDVDNFGYTLRADNPSGLLPEFERYAHDEIRLWAPADTTAIPPLLPSERIELEAGLRACLAETELDATGIDLSSSDAFDEVFQVVERQNVDEDAFVSVVECVQMYSDLGR